MCTIEELLAFDQLDKVGFDGCPAYIHRDHRWDLCLIFHAQEQGWLPKPCKLVMFDAHHDTKTPQQLEQIALARSRGYDFDGLMAICKDLLSPNDDDWIIAGMELGLIGDALIFGPRDFNELNRFRDHEDRQRNSHFIAIVGRPINELDYQGKLTDPMRGPQIARFWQKLGWTRAVNGKFEFTQSDERILLDFDLDLFVFHWSNYVEPWTEHIFECEFSQVDRNDRSGGWTGRSFIQALCNQAGLLTMCTEPDYCGGEDNLPTIIERFNRYIFDGKLIFPEIGDE